MTLPSWVDRAKKYRSGYLGGCTFWAAQEAAAASTRFAGTSIEPYAPAARAQRETARANGVNVTVVEGCVGRGRMRVRMNRQHAPESVLSDAGAECQAFLKLFVRPRRNGRYGRIRYDYELPE